LNRESDLIPRSRTARQDKELYEAEKHFASAQQEADFYMASLQALTIFRSRSERALLDTQSRAASAQREAAEARQRYEQVRVPSSPRRFGGE
jgi:hypothetical protein